MVVRIHPEPQFPHFYEIIHFTLYLSKLSVWAKYWYNNIRTSHVGYPCLIRSTGEILREQQPLKQKLKDLVLFSRFFEWVDRTQWFRYRLHRQADQSGDYENTKGSAKHIKRFIANYGIDMSAFQPSDPDAYETFNGFFTRKHKEGARPLADPGDESTTVSAADSRVVAYDSVRLTKTFWIKGHYFSIATLLGTKPGAEDEAAQIAKVWDEGSVAVYRLSPQDYHRYHAPVSGKVTWMKHIGGNYYGVDPIAVQSEISVLDSNARTALMIETGKFGKVLFVAIGADEVGSVKIDLKVGDELKRGDEVGKFMFGGSSIIVVYENGRVRWDEDIREASLLGVMVDVKVRERVGKLVNK